VAVLGRELTSLSLVIWRQARRIVILVVGSSVILFGLLLVFLPGPAFVVIPVGLAILAIEFAWARRWLRHLRVRLALVVRKTFRARRRERTIRNARDRGGRQEQDDLGRVKPSS